MRRRREKRGVGTRPCEKGPPLNHCCRVLRRHLPCSRVVWHCTVAEPRQRPSCTGAGTVTLCTRYGRRHRANSEPSGTLTGPIKYLPRTVSPVARVLAVPARGPAVKSAARLVYVANPGRLRLLLDELPAVSQFGLRDLLHTKHQTEQVRGWPWPS